VRYTGNILAACLVVFVAISACTKKQPALQTEEPSGFDKHAMLASIADNVIVPAYNNFNLSLDSFVTAFGAFSQSPDVPRLQEARKKFNSCYLLYQRISPFGFGPGEEESVRMIMNTFPADTTKINANIGSGNYDLAWPANSAAKGFPAVEFMLFGYHASDDHIVSLFSAPGRVTYINNITSDIKQRTQRIIEKWNGAYKPAYVGDAGTDIGSPIGYLINQINFELDYLKNAKVATPLGLRSDNVPHPDNCEGFYNGLSLPYAIESLNAIEQLYKGGPGIGFDDYIDHLELKNGAEPLSLKISQQFTLAREKLTAINGALNEKVVSDKAAVDAAYKELVRLLVLMKADLPSGLGVIITYQDGDGD
jgi:uncharacterized protein